MTKIATCAFPGTYDVKDNLDLHLQYINEAADAGASLVVFPECSLQGFPGDYRVSEFAAAFMPFMETVESIASGENVARIAAEATNLGIYVIYGLNEATERPGVVYNTLVLTGPGGHIGVFRKVHVGLTEQLFWRGGNDWPVYSTELGNVGMLICYDIAWPESCRELTLRGADLLVMSTAWTPYLVAGAETDSSMDHYELFNRVRAMENNRWLIASNFVGELGDFRFFGMSQIVDPSGTVVATSPQGEAGLVVADIDIPGGIIAGYSVVNEGAHIIRDRRPETYRALSGALPILIDG